jgi:hypothetical protein
VGVGVFDIKNPLRAGWWRGVRKESGYQDTLARHLLNSEVLPFGSVAVAHIIRRHTLVPAELEPKQVVG